MILQQCWEERKKLIPAHRRKSCSMTQIWQVFFSSYFPFFCQRIFSQASSWHRSGANAKRNCCEWLISLQSQCFGLDNVSGHYCFTFKWIGSTQSICQSNVLSTEHDRVSRPRLLFVYTQIYLHRHIQLNHWDGLWAKSQFCPHNARITPLIRCMIPSWRRI